MNTPSPNPPSDEGQVNPVTRAGTADSPTGTDWAAIEARRGYPIQPEDRYRIGMDVLRAETDALVNQADWIERMTAIKLDEIATAHAQGQTYEQYLAKLQDDLDDSDEDDEASFLVPLPPPQQHPHGDTPQQWGQR